MTVGELSGTSAKPAPDVLGDESDDLVILPDPEQPTSVWRSARPATLAFAIVEAVALVVWLIIGRFQWFYNDDWDFLAGRNLRNIGDLFRPHNEHWVTVPVIAYRVLFSVFGLRTYFPYRLMIVLTHLVAAALILYVMRRAGVQPWIATAAATLFAFFGAGSPDIIVPVQVCFTGALVLGLTHLILADHDGPLERRDWFGLLASAIALMFSAFAVTMVVVVGIAVLMRRGWRLALFHTAPLAVMYLTWYAAIGHEGFVAGYTDHSVIKFISLGWRTTGFAMGRSRPMWLVIRIVLVIGVALAFIARRRAKRLQQLIVPAALFAGSALFIASTATARSQFGTGYAEERRYLYLIAAMTLPLLAIAVDAFVRRWRWLLPAAIVLFLVGIPGNIHAATTSENALKPRTALIKTIMLSLAHDPVSRTVPPSINPEPSRAQAVTIGWLLHGAAQGRIPKPGPTTPKIAVQDNFRLAFTQDPTSAAVPTTGCQSLDKPLRVKLEKGDRIRFSGAILQIAPLYMQPPGIYPPLFYFPVDGHRLDVLHSTGTVVLSRDVYAWNFRVRWNLSRTPPRVCIQRAP